MKYLYNAEIGFLLTKVKNTLDKTCEEWASFKKDKN